MFIHSLLPYTHSQIIKGIGAHMFSYRLCRLCLIEFCWWPLSVLRCLFCNFFLIIISLKNYIFFILLLWLFHSRKLKWYILIKFKFIILYIRYCQWNIVNKFRHFVETIDWCPDNIIRPWAEKKKFRCIL